MGGASRLNFAIEVGLISRSGAGPAKRTASPLTPALSPLRGEGARRAILEYRTSFPAFGEYVSEHCPNAAQAPGSPSASAGTPSPLKGERAGVRVRRFVWLDLRRP